MGLVVCVMSYGMSRLCHVSTKAILCPERNSEAMRGIRDEGDNTSQQCRQGFEENC